jgi:hypothetical protein
MNLCIFTPYNFQISQEVINSSGNYVSEIVKDTNIRYMPLRYNLPNKFILLYQILDYAFRELFYNDTFDGIIYTDIKYNIKDTETLHTLTGLLSNNKSFYFGDIKSPLCLGMTKNMFEKIGKPSFKDFNLIDNLLGYHGFRVVELAHENFVTYE